MSKKIEGTFSLQQILEDTYHTKFKTRFEYAERDVLKTIVQIKETTLHPDQKQAPTVTYIFRSFSYPQYSPYNKFTKFSKQRKYKHQYDQILSIAADEDGSFSVNSINWKYRLGSQKKWNNKPPQSKIKSIYRETYDKWKLEYEKECENIKLKKVDKKEIEKLLNKAKIKFKQKIIDHKKKAPYLDPGDFNSRVNGLNGDFVYKCQSTYQHFGHLFGRNTFPEGEIHDHMFTPKHLIRLLNTLLKLGILK
jgi:hypothetical protein